MHNVCGLRWNNWRTLPIGVGAAVFIYCFVRMLGYAD